MQNISEKKKNLLYRNLSKENCSLDFQEVKLEKNFIIETRDNDRRRLEKWKIGRKNFS